MDYWLEALEYALDGRGLLDRLTEDERRGVAEDLAESARNESMFDGSHCIPDPRDAEVRELKAAHDQELAAAHRETDVYRGSVARRRGVPVEQVWSDGYDVFYG